MSTSSSPSAGAKPSENSAILDSSAYLALIQGEPGAEIVFSAIDAGAAIGSVNLAEVIARLMDLDFTKSEIDESLTKFYVPVVAFTSQAGVSAGLLRASTRHLGLSLGDRACLALAAELGVPAITADRIWQELDVGVDVVLCR